MPTLKADKYAIASQSVSPGLSAPRPPAWFTQVMIISVVAGASPRNRLLGGPLDDRIRGVIVPDSATLQVLTSHLYRKNVSLSLLRRGAGLPPGHCPGESKTEPNPMVTILVE